MRDPSTAPQDDAGTTVALAELTERDAAEPSEPHTGHGQAASKETPHVVSPKFSSSKLGQPDVEELRRLSISPAPSGRFSPGPRGPYHPAPRGWLSDEGAPASPLRRFWENNKAAILVASSQLFGSLMNLFARLLELSDTSMHPFQILLMRQSVTAACCIAYMWWTRTPNFPFGTKDVRWLLLIRAFSGFVGIMAMWTSMMYLPLADATVITFLGPGVAGIVCYFVLREPFTRTEQLATLVALMGVVLIAQPAALFSQSVDEVAPNEPEGDGGATSRGVDHDTTPRERLVAVGIALLGVCGAAGAFTTMRTIGKRVHPLISVNAFASLCTIICVVALVVSPSFNIGQPFLQWRTPTSMGQWALLLMLGVVGFIMQYLLTTGLAMDKSNRANSMIYTHMLFAASFDRWVFGHHMGLMSFAGCTLILGSAVSMVLAKKPAQTNKVEDVERQGNATGELEDAPMLVSGATETSDMQLETRR